MGDFHKNVGNLVGILAEKKARKTNGRITSKIKGIATGKVAEASAWAVGKATEDVRQRIGTQIEESYNSAMDIHKEAELLSQNPDHSKLVLCFGNSLIEGVTVRDEKSNVRYSVRKRTKNLRKVVIYQGNKKIGEVKRKKCVLQNLFSFKDLKKYVLIREKRTVGVLKTYSENMRTVGKPDFASWKILGYPLKPNFVVTDRDDEIATITRTTTNQADNYVLDFDKNMDELILLLSVIAMKMDKES